MLDSRDVYVSPETTVAISHCYIYSFSYDAPGPYNPSAVTETLK